MHPNNKYQGTYHFDKLLKTNPSLAQHIIKNPRGADTIDFSNPLSVKTLNQSLLALYYKVKSWDVPEGYLVPPIPSRSDYIHYIADIIQQSNDDLAPCMLDIGTGANLIYPIVAISQYKWKVIGSDIDQKALQNAQSIIDTNPHLTTACTLRHQPNTDLILRGIIQKSDRITVVVCNPPFHASLQQAEKASSRKQRNLNYKTGRPSQNFGGQSNELWYPGGALAFLKKYIRESCQYKSNCQWFTALISNQRIVDPLQALLKNVKAREVQIINMKHGQKISRILAWRF